MIEPVSTEPIAPDPSLEAPRAPLFFRWLTYILLAPLMIASTAFFGTLSLICGLWDTSGRQQHFIAHLWARSFLILSLSPVKLTGAEKLHLHETAVYASNHTSYYDTPDAWYRYNNGYIYQVDPTTQLVTAIVASILT